jgi:hypothetical protein
MGEPLGTMFNSGATQEEEEEVEVNGLSHFDIL